LFYLGTCYIYYLIIKPTVTKITDILSLIVVENDIFASAAKMYLGGRGEDGNI
jgi:hypothetical protein